MDPLSTEFVNTPCMATFRTYLALRYLRGAEGQAEGRKFLRLVIRIAIGGVAVGVTTLVLALAVVRGFSEEITRKIVGFGAHIQVESLKDAPLDGATGLIGVVAAHPQVDSVQPVIQEFVLVRSSRTHIDGVSIWGTRRVPDYLDASIIAGSAQLASDSSGISTMVIGAPQARTLDVGPGDVLTAFSVPATGESRPPRVAQFKVGGIYETSLADFDGIYVFAEMERVRNLVNYGPDQVTRLDVRVGESVDFEAVADELDTTLAFPAMARPISEIYRSLFAWVALQQSIIPLVLSIIVFVAAVNIIGTLLMLILEKTAEIGVLGSMGARGKDLTGVFMRVGFGIGAIGAVIGSLLAVVLAFLQVQYGIIPLPADAYYMSEAPMALRVEDFIVVSLVTVMLCTAAAWVPARYASRIMPIDAIRSR
jgi:lipoprotein-releasing system permease protein